MQKKILQSSLVYVTLGFLAPAVNFFLVPIYSHYLSKADYALITLASVVQAVITPLLNLGMVGAFSRYFYDYIHDIKLVNRLFSTTLIFYLFIGFLFWGLGLLVGPIAFQLFFANDVFTFKEYGFYILGTSVAMSIQLLTLTYYRNYEEVGKYAFWSILFFLSTAASIYLYVAVWQMGARGSIEGRMWGSTLTLLPLLIYFFKDRPLHFDWQQCRNMLPYALPLVPYLLLNVAFSNFDKALVERNFSLSQLGEYGFAVLIASVIEIIMNSVQSVFYPQIFRLLGRKSEYDTEREITNSFRATLILNLLMIAALISFTGVALHLFIDAKYWDVMNYFPLLCLVYIPRLVFTIWGIPMMYYKKTKFLPLANATALFIGIVSGLTLIKSLEIYALPIALFLVQGSLVLLTFLINNRLKIHLPSFNHLKKEYLLLLLLFFLSLLATYAFHFWVNSVFIFFPIFFLLSVLILISYRKEIRSQIGRVPFLCKG